LVFLTFKLVMIYCIYRRPLKSAVNFVSSIILVFIVSLSTGCYSYKDQILFQGLKDTSQSITDTRERPMIQAGDQLSIIVLGLDEKTTAYFNTPMGIGPNGNTQFLAQSSLQGGGIFGYVVGADGNIAFPKLGLLQVAGYNQERLRDSLQSWLLPWVKDPAVIVRLMNFRVTYITSDRAQTINLLNNQNDILQFLGMVSGITWTDRKDNVLVIRHVNGIREVHHVNLTSKEVFSSPVFYLKPNDVIYVEPNKRKFIDTNAQLISIVTSITSTLSILVLFVNSLR
jgi:polysaccharide export outer membrane protein